MKKILVILVIAALLIAFPVSAAKPADDSQGNGNGAAAALGAASKTANGIDNELKGNKSGVSATVQGNGISANLTAAERNRQEIKAQIKLIQKENANITGLSSNNRVMNENKIRVAVQTLLAAGNISGGIGPQISAIAKELNNSVTAQNKAEEKIQNRNAISRFFFGGDSEAAGEIQQQIEANRVRLGNLDNLMNQCGEDCDGELKAMIQEQIQLLEQDQNRLQELSQAELNDKGLLGGLFG
ncbi:MAG: hypothetical protein JW931_10075 [Methanomicrobiaceae archaeon]|nr:hypothetical protein [Methanomicrobiaceae archaeon]